MKLNKLILLAVVLFAAASCKDNAKEEKTETENFKKEVVAGKEVAQEVTQIEFALESKSESTAIGNVSFTERDGTVSMEAKLSGLTEGVHAIHIHEKADCSSADGKSSGGHWNPTFQNHGAWGDAAGYHKGDIGNFTADASGNASVTFSTDQWCIGCDDPNKDIMGKAIIVHQGEDDLKSQPSGAAGARVSCGGIIQ